MTTGVVVPGIKREFSQDMFQDITESEFRTDRNDVGEYIFTFADDLSEDQVAAVRLRCDLTVDQENVRTQALRTLATLKELSDTTETLSLEELTNGIKTLANTLHDVVQVLYNQVN